VPDQEVRLSVVGRCAFLHAAPQRPRRVSRRAGLLALAGARARGPLLYGGYKLVVPRVGALRLHDLRSDPGERVDRSASAPIALRVLRNVFGLHVAYESAWRRQRWGGPAALAPAFAADHGS
jgi:hypothetical protein